MSEAYRKSMCKCLLPSVFVSTSSHRRTFAQVYVQQCPPQYDDIKIITSPLTPPSRDSTTLCLLHAISSVVSFRYTQQIRAFSHKCKNAQRVFFCLTIHLHIASIFASFSNTAEHRRKLFATRASACNVFLPRGVHHTPESGVYSTHRRREMHCYCCFSMNITHSQESRARLCFGCVASVAG